ncbi:MAG: hypothetical protein KME29_32375 [Calothrix sp. FI2-JRJ7]|jgi:hypothetical protein|nr:hypothetical protein [Calothrix sp. FI2-JRJ7]
MYNLTSFKTLNTKQQQEELIILQQTSLSESDSIISSFGEVGENLGWNGWCRSGYRDTSGMLHKGINPLRAFVSDLTREYQYQQQTMV